MIANKRRIWPAFVRASEILRRPDRPKGVGPSPAPDRAQLSRAAAAGRDPPVSGLRHVTREHERSAGRPTFCPAGIRDAAIAAAGNERAVKAAIEAQVDAAPGRALLS